MSLSDCNLKSQEQVLKFYKKIINDNHTIVIDQIKNSIDKLIAQLQQRENELLYEANKSRLIQTDISINKLEPPPNIYFDEANLDDLLTKLSSFGQLSLSNNETNNWSQLKPINQNNEDNLSNNNSSLLTESDDDILKYARSVLNKLNQSNYEKLNYDLTEYLNNYIENENIQIKISYQFVDTVMFQSNLFSNLYANLIYSLIKSFESNSIGKKLRINFLNCLQKRFESSCLGIGTTSSPNFTKTQLVNLVGFIGELFRIGQLTNEIVIDCVYNLFFSSDKTDKIDETRLELGLKLLISIEPCLVIDRSNSDIYTKLNIKLLKCFDLLDELMLYNSVNLANSKKISSRLKFMIMDYVDAKSKIK